MSRKDRFTRTAFIWSLSLLPMLPGCSSNGVPTYPVRGQVVFADGEPVKFGRVEFYHAGHDLTSSGTIQSDGSFQLSTYSERDGAPAGSHDVVVTQIIMMGQAGVTPHDHGRHVSQQYSKYETSDLQFEVTPTRDNEFRIVVESTGR